MTTPAFPLATTFARRLHCDSRAGRASGYGDGTTIGRDAHSDATRSQALDLTFEWRESLRARHCARYRGA